MLILDSNIISYYLRGDPLVVPRVQALVPADVGVPAIVEYEMRYGLIVESLQRPRAGEPRAAKWSMIRRRLA